MARPATPGAFGEHAVDQSLPNAIGPDDGNDPDRTEAESLTPKELRLRAVASAARFYGIDLDINDYRGPSSEVFPSPASLVNWLREQGLTARGAMLKWKNLFRFRETSPVVVLLKDGTAGLVIGADAKHDIVWVKSPTARDSEPPVAVDRMRMEQAWGGEVILVRRNKHVPDGEAPFTLGWIFGQVLGERKILYQISYASLVLSALAIIPAFLVMGTIDRVLEYNSLPTFYLLTAILGVMMFFDCVLGWARRELINVVAAKLDTRLNLHLFARLLSLPLDFFERNQAGETISRLRNVTRVREFLTGKLLQTILDGCTLFVMVPFMFYMEALLGAITMAVAGLMALILVIFMKPVGRLIGLYVHAEHKKAAVITETVQGIRTVKTLAMEPQQKQAWDERTAEASGWLLAASRMANWPQTLTDPLQTFMSRGVVLLGAYLALQANSGVDRGALIAFMMLSSRVSSPLAGFARLMEDFQEVRTSIGQIAKVLNNPPEVRSVTDGMRPRFEGRIAFEDVTFTYPMGSRPALNRISFELTPGTMLGLVGRSGSGKSTITRLLQGVNREYSGAVKIDGAEMREINLAHLRRSLGVVLQDNFLFRGTVKENIIAGRPGLTVEDAVRAARLAGAEEFIEKMPQGYDTWIEEGSANISGGQRQRLAIARALISNPRIMILDEATSALDPESEALVNANLVRIGKGRTMVIVSHRLSSLVNCDLLMVMDQGKLIDIAPHDTLLGRCSIYRTLWNQQNRHIAGAHVANALTQGE
jgi:HlyB family type I secretion system ABC transporter